MKILLTFVLACMIALPAHAQQTGWLGVSVEDGKDQGATIRSVETDSPAAKAGLKSGDLITEYNRTPVLGSVQLSRLIRETPPGRTVDLKFRRDNRDQTVQITTATAQDRTVTFFRNGPTIDLRDRLESVRNAVPRFQMTFSYSRSGIHVQDMTSQLRDFFGINSNNGVLVVMVDRASAGETAGIKAGDVIIAVDGHGIRSPYDFDREMRATARVTVRVMRDKKESDIVVDRSTDSR
jgi:serine protease Do